MTVLLVLKLHYPIGVTPRKRILRFLRFSSKFLCVLYNDFFRVPLPLFSRDVRNDLCDLLITIAILSRIPTAVHNALWRDIVVIFSSQSKIHILFLYV